MTTATGQTFWGLSTGFRQGMHKSLLTTGRWMFLLGGDVGPSFSSAQPSGMNVNFSSSFVVTTIVQLTPVVSFVAPERMLYVGGLVGILYYKPDSLLTFRPWRRSKKTNLSNDLWRHFNVDCVFGHIRTVRH
jgi:hypothetical protein